MLRIVHPPREGQPTDPPARRRKGYKAPALFLTDEEVRHFRASVRNVARAYGSLECLASVIGVRSTVLSSKRRPGVALALAVARAAGMTLEAVIGGKLSPAGRCPTCGTRAGDRPALTAGGSHA